MANRTVTTKNKQRVNSVNDVVTMPRWDTGSDNVVGLEPIQPGLMAPMHIS